MVMAVSSSRDASAASIDQLEEPTMAMLGEGSCGYEDDEDKLVVCGRELLGEFVDASWLVMPEGQCSVLLDKLFSQQTCAFDDPDCHRFNPAAPLPPLPKLQSSSSSPTIVTEYDPADAASQTGWLIAADDDVPASLSNSPPAPPPRGANA